MCDTAYTNGTETKEWSIEAAMKAMHQFKAKVDSLPPVAEVIYLTQDEYETLKEQAFSNEPASGSDYREVHKRLRHYGSMNGIPIEIHEREEFVTAALWEHQKTGRNVGFFRDGVFVVYDKKAYREIMGEPREIRFPSHEFSMAKHSLRYG